MCYSAQIVASWKRYLRLFKAQISLADFAKVFFRRADDANVKLPRALELALVQELSNGPSRDEPLASELLAASAAHQQQQTQKYEQELFAQRKRLADAQRSLQTKTTKSAQSSARIAGNKIQRALDKLAELRRSDILEADERIFPGLYAPVLVMEGDKLLIKPMRYGCRPTGKPAFYDQKYPGTYNARRDNLTGFWRGQFGASHGLLLASAFYENVSRHKAEGRELAPGETPANLVLKFQPNVIENEVMLLACLWAHWTPPLGSQEPDLLSFAAITDEPPAEVAAAGHDRCVIPIKLEHALAWLQPQNQSPAQLQAILDDRERPFYDHRLVQPLAA